MRHQNDRLFVGNHRQLVAKTGSRYSQVATVVWWSVPCAFSGLFLLMKWNGRAATMGYSVLCLAKIGVNKPEINEGGVGGVECMLLYVPTAAFVGRDEGRWKQKVISESHFGITVAVERQK